MLHWNYSLLEQSVRASAEKLTHVLIPDFPPKLEIGLHYLGRSMKVNFSAQVSELSRTYKQACQVHVCAVSRFFITSYKSEL